MPLSKKIFIFSLSIFIILILFGGIYFFIFKKDSTKKVTSIKKPSSTKEEQMIEKDRGIILISDEKVLSPVLFKDNSAIRYYAKETGKAYQIEFDGSKKMFISKKELSGLNNVLWSPNGEKVISHFFNTFTYYNYNTRESAELSKGLSDIVWQNNDKILYKYYNEATKENTLNISDPDGNNWKKITDLNSQPLTIFPIPLSGIISFWNKGNGFEETRLETISVLGGEKKTIFKDKFGTDYLWSPDSNNLLISHLAEKGSSKIQLAITNSKGGEYKNLDIPTIVSKCVWSKNSPIIYYALPGMIPTNTVMPNDYFANKFKSADTFWKVDITTGEKERLINLNKLKDLPSIDAANLFLNEDESFLFFTNRSDEKLYRLDL